MSDSIPAVPAPQAPRRRGGAIATSLAAQITFLLALAASAAWAWLKGDNTLLVAMCGVAATNATTVVGYWVGSSDGSAHKTEIMSSASTPKTT